MSPTHAYPPPSSMTADEIKAELTEHETKHGMHRPTRSTIDASRPWRFGLPNYDKSDLLFFRGRTTKHAKGSLEDIVENAVKTWEMEASHLHFPDWHSVDHDKYVVSANGAKRYEKEEGAEAGNYNWLLAGCDKSLYDSEKESFESSHELFRGAFLDGFPWELVAVFAGPPRVAFSWRHWGVFDGRYGERQGDGRVYDMFGWAVVTVDENLKIGEIEVFYKPDEFLRALKEGGGEDGRETLVGTGCPFLSGTMG